MAYPVHGDITTDLTALGVTSALSTGEITNLISAAVAEWERMTGYSPFLASGTVSTRYYDPPTSGRVVLVRDGIATATGLIVTCSGTTKTINTDFYLKPANSEAKNFPYTHLLFNGFVTGLPNSIAITARFGFCTTLPDSVFQAIKRMVEIYLLRFEVMKQYGNLESWKDDDVSEKYSSTPFSGILDTWKSEIAMALRLYSSKGVYF